MRSTAILFLTAMVLTTGCRTENCPTGMEKGDNGLCIDVEMDEEFDTGTMLDTGGQE